MAEHSRGFPHCQTSERSPHTRAPILAAHARATDRPSKRHRHPPDGRDASGHGGRRRRR